MNKILGRRVMEEMPKEDRKGGKRGDMTKPIEWVMEAMSEMKKKKKNQGKRIAKKGSSDHRRWRDGGSGGISFILIEEIIIIYIPKKKKKAEQERVVGSRVYHKGKGKVSEKEGGHMNEWKKKNE